MKNRMTSRMKKAKIPSKDARTATVADVEAVEVVKAVTAAAVAVAVDAGATTRLSWPSSLPRLFLATTTFSVACPT